jgi:hypothetical protein
MFLLQPIKLECMYDSQSARFCLAVYKISPDFIDRRSKK